jgi:hypothetical protein
VLDPKNVIGAHSIPNAATLPITGMPRVEFLEHNFARWTFATSDRTIQEREFESWRGWFRFDETDEPDEVEVTSGLFDNGLRRDRAWDPCHHGAYGPMAGDGTFAL